MSERIDRRIGSGRLLLATIVIIFILAAVSGAFVLMEMRRTPQSMPGDSSTQAEQLAGSDEPLIISLHIPVDGILAPGTVGVKRQPDTQGQAREVLIGLFSDPRIVQSPVLNELKLRELFLDRAGTAYVDLAVVPTAGIKASAWEELIAIYSIVNTLMLNFEEISHVRFLLDGREARTLAGHIDFSRKFAKRTDLGK